MEKGNLETEKVASIFLESLRKEQSLLTDRFPICELLIDEAFDRYYSTGILPGNENFADLINGNPIRLIQNVVLTNKVLNSETNFLKTLQNETQCTIKIKGKNSMKDKEQEEKLRRSRHPKYNHLHKELYLEISTEATPIECYNRIANALKEIRKYLLSEQNDTMIEEYLDEMDFETEEDNTELPICENAKTDDDSQDPLVDLFKEPILALDTISNNQESDIKPYFTLADRLIKLLDETVLNPKFKLRQAETVQPSKQITNFSTNDDAIDTNSNSEENISNFAESETFGTTNKNDIQNAQNFNQSNIVIKDVFEAGPKPKKENYPGIYYLKDKKSNKIIRHRILQRSALYRFLKRNKNESVKPEENSDEKPVTFKFLQKNPSELVFEYTPREIMISFLENLRNYPVLWEFHDKPFNNDYITATEKLCQIINAQWSLNIDQLCIRRSICRVLRFYRYLYPYERIDKFSEYFEICAAFLPSAVIKIPHARCIHCFKCCTGDYELKKHYLQEHKSIKWRYRCVYCAENFRNISEYDFHKRLPHFVEMFTCEQCDKRFCIAHAYREHMITHQSVAAKTKKMKKTIGVKQVKDNATQEIQQNAAETKQNKENSTKENQKNDFTERKCESKEITTSIVILKNHICEKCSKGFKTSRELTLHKVYHGKKKYKCHLCPKSYFKNTFLQLHIKNHRNQRDFICEICGAKFISGPSLKSHIDTHLGVRKPCNICGLKVRKNNMLRHLKTIHVACEGTLEDTFRARGFNHRQLQSGAGKSRKFAFRRTRGPEKFPRKYACKICNIDFERLKLLKDHNQEFHPFSIPKKICKICNAGIRNTNLKRHYREKHKLKEDEIHALESDQKDNDTV